MTRLAIVVEGPTEREFVQRVLADYLLPKEIYPYSKSLGGDVRVDRLASHMAKYLQSFDSVSCLVDFYGFRGKGNTTPNELENLIFEEINRRTHTTWTEARVIPYVQLHEF